jgi:hypothetical protein
MLRHQFLYHTKGIKLRLRLICANKKYQNLDYKKDIPSIELYVRQNTHMYHYLRRGK